MIKEILLTKKKDRIGSGKFNISKIGQCRRRTYLEIKGLYKEEFSEELLRIFNLGNLFHKEIVNELLSKGDSQGIHITATEIDVGNEFISGRIDILVSDGKENYVIDVKSASSYTIKKLKEGECSENYKNQVLLYMWFSGIHNGILLFIGKERGEIVEVPVVYDEEKAEKLIQEIEDFFINYVNKDLIPEKCDGGMFGCDCCETKGTIKDRKV